MFPESIFLGIGLYELLFAVGVFLAMLTFRILADREKYPAKLQNLVLGAILFAVVAGYPSSVLVQAVYNAIESGKFELARNTGATFYGGLVGGTLAFLLFYFVGGRFAFPEKEHIRYFPNFLGLAPCCITIAHALGRLGCLMAGCCYGKETTAWFGIYLKGIPHKVIPTQLFEALFLFVLFAFLVSRYLSKDRYNMSVYLCGYGIWRFFIEYARGDDRGQTIVPFLTPSQLTAIVLIAVGIALVFFEKKLWLRFADATPQKPGTPPTETPGTGDPGADNTNNAENTVDPTENA